ncbi:hypothetical protein GIX45_23990 [Erwinia sp. CPCC 100877]|nr:hypothetical protein [Erwinia sp. CPCC 100877]
MKEISRLTRAGQAAIVSSEACSLRKIILEVKTKVTKVPAIGVKGEQYEATLESQIFNSDF